MMRKGKFLSYILTFSFAFLVASGVKAAACEPGNIVTIAPGTRGSGFSNSINYLYSGGEASLPTLNYLVTKNSNGQQLTAFCLDPEFHGPGDSGMGATKQQYCLTPISDKSIRDALFYLYYNAAPSTFMSLSEGDAWQATNIAARLVSYKKGFGKGSGNIVYNAASGSVFKSTLALIDSGFYDEFIRTKDINSLRNKLAGSSPALLASSNANTLATALQLYKSAASASYGANDILTLKLSAASEEYNSYVSGGRAYADVKLKLTGFGNLLSDSKVMNPQIVLSSNPGFSFNIYSDANFSSAISSTADIKSMVSNGELILYVRISGAQSLQSQLLSTKYNIYIDIFDRRSDLNVQIASPITNTRLQRMVVFNVDKPNTVTNIPPFDIGGNNPACRIVNGQYCLTENGKETCNNSLDNFLEHEGGLCCKTVDRESLNDNDKKTWDKYCSSPCTPEFDFPTACDPDGSNTVGYIKESDKFASCIIDKNDYNNDAYNASSTMALTGNRFCQVYCKEDYEYQFPGRQYSIAAGYYFKLDNAKITGTRTCVTNDVKIQLFLEELRKINKEILAAHRRMKEATLALQNITKGSDGCSGDYACGTDDEGNTIYCSCDPWDCETETLSGFSYEYWDVDGTGALISQTGRVSSASSGSCGGPCGGCDPATLTEEWSSRLSVATADYQRWLSARPGLIAEYKACASWANSDHHSFDPVLEYEYDEELYNDMLESTFESSDLPSDRKLELCTPASNVNINDSTRTYGSRVEKDQNYSCVNAESQMANNRIITYLDCTVTECRDIGSQSVNMVPNYANIKQVSTKAKEYYSPNVFYTEIPSSEVTVGTDGTVSVGNNVVEMVVDPEKNASYFAVLITTEDGLHKFKFTATNSAQYNQNNQLGRFDEMYGATKMEYVCEYEVTGELCLYCPPVVTPSCPSCPPVVNKVGGVNVFYRPISTNDVFPNSTGTYAGKSGILNDRRPGENWLSTKGQATQKEIESGTGKSTETNELQPEYSFTLTPTQMKKIRQYNHQQEGAMGAYLGYNDFNMNCFNPNGGDDPTDYYICESEFLKDNDNNYFTDLRDLSNRKIEFTQWTGSVYETQGPAWK